MKNRTLHYVFGILFLVMALYQVYRRDAAEACLYFLAGLAFSFNTLASEPRLLRFKKVLTIVTWVLIFVTGLLFLYLLQFKDL